MSIYTQAIQLLLEKQAIKTITTQFLTLYIPTRERFKKEEIKRLKGYILEGLKDYEVADVGDKFHKKIIEAVTKKLDSLADLAEGIALFGRIDTDEFKIDQAVVLSRKPRKELFIGDIYDLDQLIFISSMIDDAVVVRLTREQADIYTLVNNKLFALQTLENEFALRKEKPDLNRFKPTGTDMSMHGVGDKSLQQREFKENQEHLREVGEYLATDVMCAKEFPFLVIYYSEQYNDVLDGWVDKYKTKFCNPKVISIAKTFKSTKQLEQHTTQLLAKYKRRDRKRLLKAAKEDYQKIVWGWDEVYNAAKLGNIDSLFIKQHVEDRFHNVAAEVVTQVSLTNGKIIMLGENDTPEPVVAKLRFRV